MADFALLARFACLDEDRVQKIANEARRAQLRSANKARTAKEVDGLIRRLRDELWSPREGDRQAGARPQHYFNRIARGLGAIRRQPGDVNAGDIGRDQPRLRFVAKAKRGDHGRPVLAVWMEIAERWRDRAVITANIAKIETRRAIIGDRFAAPP